MWIMLNNKPFNVMDIKDISEVITLDSQYLYTVADGIPSVLLPETCREKSICELRKEMESNNIVYGYFFYISRYTTIQCYVNDIPQGTKRGTTQIYSKVYSTKKAAQTALEYLLSEINEVYNKLVKVEI